MRVRHFLNVCIFILIVSLNSCHGVELRSNNEYLKNEVWDCDRTWPDLSLLLAVNVNDKLLRKPNEWTRIFLRSFLLFWPLEVSKTKLVIVLDAEKSRSTHFQSVATTANMLNEIIPGGCESRLSEPSTYYHDLGWIRQQLMGFYADNFTTSEFVGIIDTDALILTAVDREDLFEDGKPVVNGFRKPYTDLQGQDGYYIKKETTTKSVLGLEQPMNFMSSFPIIMRTSHLKELRTFIEKRSGLPFLEAFNNFTANDNAFGHFDIMLTYLFHHHRDSYRWYVHEVIPGWDGLTPPATFGQMQNRSTFDEYMFEPKPRIAVHASYRYRRTSIHKPTPKDSTHLNFLLIRGICHTLATVNTSITARYGLHHRTTTEPKNVQNQYWECDPSHKSVTGEGYFDEMHNFELFDWNFVVPKSKLVEVHARRNARFQRCSHTWTRYSIDHWFLSDGDAFMCADIAKQVFYVNNRTVHAMSPQVIADWKSNHTWNSIKTVALEHMLLFSQGEAMGIGHPLAVWHPNTHKPLPPHINHNYTRDHPLWLEQR